MGGKKKNSQRNEKCCIHTHAARSKGKYINI